MQLKLKRYFSFIMILILTSCETDKERLHQKIVGQWAIDEITYEGENIKDGLMINFMTFDQNAFSIPKIWNYSAERKENGTQWETEVQQNTPPTLTLKCKNPVFNGTYQIRFVKKEDKKLLSIIMKSEKTVIIADKFFQNFDVMGKDWEMEN